MRNWKRQSYDAVDIDLRFNENLSEELSFGFVARDIMSICTRQNNFDLMDCLHGNLQ
jgi:hypothetical protein